MRRPVALLALALIVTGCAESPPGHLTRAGAPPRVVRHPQLRVGLTEWTIVTSRSQVSSGRITLVVTNAGATVHDLVVHDSSGTWETADLRPGEQTGLVVRARSHETLHLWCSMPGHRTQGMDTTVSVS